MGYELRELKDVRTMIDAGGIKEATVFRARWGDGGYGVLVVLKNGHHVEIKSQRQQGAGGKVYKTLESARLELDRLGIRFFSVDLE